MEVSGVKSEVRRRYAEAARGGGCCGGGGAVTRLRSRIPNRPGSGAFLLGFLFALAFCPYSARSTSAC